MKDKEQILEALKIAMQGELDSINLYMEATVKSTDEDVKKFFSERVCEEKQHYNYLLNAYKDFDEEKSAVDLTIELTTNHPFSPIITQDFVKRISENSFLFSAISTGVLLEKNAFNYYEEQADKSTHESLKKLYKTLANWEKVHYDDLLKLQKEAQTVYWEINSFEPF